MSDAETVQVLKNQVDRWFTELVDLSGLTTDHTFDEIIQHLRGRLAPVDPSFSASLSHAFEIYGVPLLDFAVVMQVSPTTVGRWLAGTACPAESTQRHAMHALESYM